MWILLLCIKSDCLSLHGQAHLYHLNEIIVSRNTRYDLRPTNKTYLASSDLILNT